MTSAYENVRSILFYTGMAGVEQEGSQENSNDFGIHDFSKRLPTMQNVLLIDRNLFVQKIDLSMYVRLTILNQNLDSARY